MKAMRNTPRTWKLLLAALLLAAVALLAAVSGRGDMAGSARAQDDWCGKLDQNIAALNRGEIDEGLKDFADDMVFVVGPLCAPEECVGRDAFRNYLEYLVALETQSTITSCEASGDTIAVTSELRGWHERAAGVDRAIFRQAYQFEGDTLVSFRVLGLDMKDPQTAEFWRWYSEERSGATFAMGPGRDADQSPGTAVLEGYPEFSGVAVRIEAGPTGVPQPVNVHEGTCADLGPVAFALTDMAGGVSHTVLEGVPVSELQTGGFAIAVQKSEDEADVFVACGDIPAPEAVVAGSGGLLGEEGSGAATWCYALGAAGILLVMGGLAGLRRARRAARYRRGTSSRCSGSSGIAACDGVQGDTGRACRRVRSNGGQG